MEPAGGDHSLMRAEAARGTAAPTLAAIFFRRAWDVARLMLVHPDMLRPLNFADVAVRSEGNHWVVVDHADRPVLDQRFSDRFSAISLGLLVAHQQGGAVWIDELEAACERPAHMQVFH
jgi:hypothetical protein